MSIKQRFYLAKLDIVNTRKYNSKYLSLVWTNFYKEIFLCAEKKKRINYGYILLKEKENINYVIKTKRLDITFSISIGQDLVFCTNFQLCVVDILLCTKSFSSAFNLSVTTPILAYLIPIKVFTWVIFLTHMHSINNI